MSIKLYDHQKHARKLMMFNKEFALFMEQGTGKTLPVLFHLAYLINIGEVDKAIIIAPLSSTGAWSRDIGKLSPRQQELLKNVVIINYDRFWRRKEIMDTTWDFICLDESQFIKHRNSKRSKGVRKLARKAKYKYILSGTPMSNSKLYEYWSQYDFLNPSIFGTFKQFSDRFCRMNQYNVPYAYNHVDILTEMINAHAYRVTKEECLDLPDKLPDEIIKVPMTKGARIYKQAMQSYIEDLDIVADNPLVRTLRLRQISNGFVSDEDKVIHEVNTDKIKYLEDMLTIRDGEKTVIFAHFKENISRISALLTKMKIKYVVLDGDQKNKQIWKDFQTDESIQVIVCQYDSANAGIDLFASDTIIFYEPTLSSSVNDQAKDRIHRIGQTKKVSYYYLLAENTIEEKIYKTISKGSDFGKEVLLDYIRKGE